MLVELSVMEQRYQAVMAVVQDGWRVVEVARRLGVSSPARSAPPRTTRPSPSEPGRGGSHAGSPPTG